MDKISSVIQKKINYAVFPIVCVDHCGYLTGTTIAELSHDGEKIARALEYGYKLYQYDMVLVFLDAYVEAQALGCPVNLDPYPILLGPRSDEALDRTPEIIKAAEIIKNRIDVPVFVSIKGPFTLAAFTVGLENFLKMVIKNPENARKHISCVTSFQSGYLERLLKIGVNIFIGDPVASASVISPSVFRDFAYEPLDILLKQIRKQNAISGIHICGDTAPIIPMIDKLNPDILSIEDITLETQITKMGGVATSTILDGNLSKIKNEVKKAMDESYLIISTSCDVPFNTDPGNIKHMIAWAHEYCRN